MSHSADVYEIDPLTGTYLGPPYEGGFVYAIGTSDARHVKIGFTSNLERRLSQIQVGCPMELQILWWTEAGSSLEAAFHRIFSHQRIRGEWFDLGHDRLSMLEALHEEIYAYDDYTIQQDAAREHAREKASRIRAAVLAAAKRSDTQQLGPAPTQVPPAPPAVSAFLEGGRVQVTMHLPDAAAPGGPVEWMAVLSQGQHLGRLALPLGGGPHFQRRAYPGHTERFVVFAGNRAGVSTASPALEFRVPRDSSYET